MPCFVALIGFFFPRLAMVGLFLFTDYMGRAFQTALWPVLGFIFMPFTTRSAPSAEQQRRQHQRDLPRPAVVGVLLDLGVLSGGGQEARRRRMVVVRVDPSGPA